MLKEAWLKIKKKASAPGLDNQTIEDVENYGVEKYLQELREELRKQIYQPQPIKRIYIPKANGKLRPIGMLYKGQNSTDSMQTDNRTDIRS